MSLASSLNQAVWSIDRELPVARVRTMDRMMGDASADSRFRAYLLGACGLLGLLLAIVGVYGVMAYAAASVQGVPAFSGTWKLELGTELSKFRRGDALEVAKAGSAEAGKWRKWVA